MNISDSLFNILKKYTTPKELAWIEAKSEGYTPILQAAFVATPRFLSKIQLSETEESPFNTWTLDRLVRVYFLIKLDNLVKEKDISVFDTLFDTAENNEMVALISALPFLSNPENWLLRATNAVRSNIGLVFDAIAFDNPYPKQYFSDLAWNQLVLKCIFNDKSIHNIQGINERANPELAHSISNLAHERWAAGRTIPPQSWRLVSRFLNEQVLNDMRILFASNIEKDQIAAALVCTETDFLPAKSVLEEQLKVNPNLKNKKLDWQILEF